MWLGSGTRVKGKMCLPLGERAGAKARAEFNKDVQFTQPWAASGPDLHNALDYRRGTQLQKAACMSLQRTVI